MQDLTRLAQLGRNGHSGFVNPPISRGSTVLFPSVDALHAAGGKREAYGRYGSATTWALEDALAQLEGGAGTLLAPSGLAAITTALLAVLAPGDHLLVTDSAYGPTRGFCDRVLRRMGIATTYYDPLLGEGLAELMRPNTRAVFVESPGSLTFEVQDIPALARVAHAGGAVVIADNTWLTPLHSNAFALGVDISLHAGTKYIVGHSDALLGVITCNEASLPRLRAMHHDLGLSYGAEDAYLALRGLRTLGLRLQRHQESALAIAQWLAARPEVARVIYPALPGDAGYGLWKRDHGVACGLFAFELHPCDTKAVNALLDGMKLFGMGYSWGGFESLILPIDPAPLRKARTWHSAGPLIRLHVGLEAAADLIADLEQGLARLGKA